MCIIKLTCGMAKTVPRIPPVWLTVDEVVEEEEEEEVGLWLLVEPT